MNYVDIWNKCLSSIREHVSGDSFSTWFGPIRAVKLENNVLTIEVPSQFFYEYLEAHFLELLKSAIREHIGPNGRLEYSIVVDNAAPNGIPTTVKMPVSSSHSGVKNNPVNPPIHSEKLVPNPFIIPGIKRFEWESNLNSAYTFDNLIEGDCNRLARSAGFAVSHKPGGTAYNPLYVFGSTGLGKTHLLQAIGNEIKKQHPEKTVIYITSERFINQFMDSVRTNTVSDLMQMYQTMDALLIDDIQFFANKEKTQDTFFHVFNHLRQSGKQIVVASDRPAHELQGIEERLISRLKWGLSASLQMPDYDTRISILKTKMYQNGIELPEEVVEYLAHHITNSIRELEGALVSLLAQSSLNRREIDVDLAKNLLQTFVNKVAKEISIDSVQKVVCDFIGVKIDDLVAQSRKREIVQARQLAMYFAKELTNQSLKTIGLHFGGRDHSTVIHSLQTVNNLMDTDKDFNKQVHLLRKKLSMELN
ncbi:MAG: chromosomal replication initiator protein DnaA [Bacteroidia bacterium]|nr:chromosomal replication initiator protein DnaA [Bacteroidia bacterium]